MEATAQTNYTTFNFAAIYLGTYGYSLTTLGSKTATPSTQYWQLKVGANIDSASLFQEGYDNWYPFNNSVMVWTLIGGKDPSLAAVEVK